MADILWPLHIVPNTMPWKIIDSTAAFSSPTSGYTRTASTYGIRRWGTSINRDNLRTTDRAYITALIAGLRGRANRIYIPCFPYKQRGAFPTGELLTNNLFDTVGAWTGDGNSAVTERNRTLRATRVGTATSNLLYTPPATVVANANYVLQMLIRQGKGLATSSMQIGAGSTQSNYSYGSSGGQTGFAYRIWSFVPTSTTAYGAFQSSNVGTAIGDYLDFLYVSMSRCILVAGASQSGSSLNVDGGPVSLEQSLLAGDMAEIVLPNSSQLVRLTADLDLNSSGAGYLQFEPALRQVPADNAPVIINNPMGRFMLEDGTIEWDNRPGLSGNPFMDTSISFVESVQ